MLVLYKNGLWLSCEKEDLSPSPQAMSGLHKHHVNLKCVKVVVGAIIPSFIRMRNSFSENLPTNDFICLIIFLVLSAVFQSLTVNVWRIIGPYGAVLTGIAFIAIVATCCGKAGGLRPWVFFLLLFLQPKVCNVVSSDSKVRLQSRRSAIHLRRIVSCTTYIASYVGLFSSDLFSACNYWYIIWRQWVLLWNNANTVRIIFRRRSCSINFLFSFTAPIRLYSLRQRLQGTYPRTTNRSLRNASSNHSFRHTRHFSSSWDMPKWRPSLMVTNRIAIGVSERRLSRCSSCHFLRGARIDRSSTWYQRGLVGWQHLSYATLQWTVLSELMLVSTI